MLTPFTIASLWLALAIIATILANRLKISMALLEICIGAIAGYFSTRYIGPDSMGTNLGWLKFLAASGAVLLTFLAGAELDPISLKTKLKEVSIVGFLGFLAPFVGCTLIARFLLTWDVRASLLAGVALSTTSMAVVYAVMLESGFNQTEFGKGILGACFINDLGTVIALGLIFAPFTYKTLIFLGVSAAVLILAPTITGTLTRLFGYRTAAIRTKLVLFALFGLGALALWSGSEAVLPAYLLGMILAGIIAQDHHFIRRLRTLTIGFLTPFYFIRAGALVSIPAIIATPMIFVGFLAMKVLSKIFGLYPVISLFREHQKERWYYTLMMSTGLTFGTISSLYGLTHRIVSQEQYSYLVATVIASAVIPTLIADKAFLPDYLLHVPMADEEIPQLDSVLDNNGNHDNRELDEA